MNQGGKHHTNLAQQPATPRSKQHRSTSRPRLSWKALYYDLYRQTHGELAADQEIEADARERAALLAHTSSSRPPL
ncbi:hypothetical protein EI42_05750 [Thermosporothrix hazakensis]|uniref:Uncharacterized protein n=1 Tax=Thermosporothrix hazakensis TaxID=644383 RepID=A0A326TYX1_THEHA|nr:hypothetical protein [Thermosporothrix hazakensis]PZW20989.1 hypothetical protein EI42_05750 [Thermosporothrix hazakensis]GCE49272.1 hypothetical protein KTH_41410 [Thermosporothrix hazakensis]